MKPDSPPRPSLKAFVARNSFLDTVWSRKPEAAAAAERIASELGVSPAALMIGEWYHGALGLVGKKTVFTYMPAGMHSADGRWLEKQAAGPWRVSKVLSPAVERVIVTIGEAACLRLIAAGLEDRPGTAVVALPSRRFPAAWAGFFADRDVLLAFTTDSRSTRRIERLIGAAARSCTALPKERTFLNRTAAEVLAEARWAEAAGTKLVSWLRGETDDEPAVATPPGPEDEFPPERIRAIVTKHSPSLTTMRNAIRSHFPPERLKSAITSLPEDSRERLAAMFATRPVKRILKFGKAKSRRK